MKRIYRRWRRWHARCWERQAAYHMTHTRGSFDIF
jgi:hypothetical protein